VFEALCKTDRYTTPDGEEWRAIAYPSYRHSTSSHAWKYVSSWGRLLSGDLRLGEAKPGKGYFQTTLTVHIDGACGGMETVALHRIVAYTFLGPPPSPCHTVDHRDRVRENNRVSNLAWVPLYEQLANREASSYVLGVVGGPIFQTITALARYVGLGTPMLSSLLRHARPGDMVTVQGITVCVQEVFRRNMSPPSMNASTQSPSPAIPRGMKRRTVVLHYVCAGLSIPDITEQMGISRSTVLSYLGQAAREADASTLQRLASRLGLDDPGTRRRLRDQLLNLSQDPPVTSEEFENSYRIIVEGSLSPNVVAEWEAVRQTFRSICTMLEDAVPVRRAT